MWNWLASRPPRRGASLAALLAAVLIALVGALAAYPARADAAELSVGGDSGRALNSQLITGLTEPTTLRLVGDVELSEQLVIPAGKDVTLVDDGQTRTISFKADTFGSDSGLTSTGISVEAGARLTIGAGGDGAGSHIAINASNFKCTESRGMSVIASEGDLTLAGGAITGLNLSGDVSDIHVVTVREAGVFTMTGGEIRDNTFGSSDGNSQYCAAVWVERDGSFAMSGGRIENNGYESVVGMHWGSAAVVLDASDGNPRFHMTGGTIADNDGLYYGGVLAGTEYANYYSDPEPISHQATFTMDGGTITGNNARYCGGGVAVMGNASFYMNGGTISSNSALMGGGIAVYDFYVSFFGKTPAEGDPSLETWGALPSEGGYGMPGRFVMNGGSITDNAASVQMTPSSQYDYGCGGGVYVASDNCEIRGGFIEGNYASSQGGGIYVGSTPYTLRMYDTVVTDNDATILGGGLWFCPTGDATLAVTNGAAVFGNDAGDGTDAAGDDFVAVPSNGKTHEVNLADRMLGGGAVEWYVDGGVRNERDDGASNVLGLADGSARYAVDDEGSPVTERVEGITDATDGMALRAVTSDNAEALAGSLASVRVSGNSAPRGGGIGSNGGLVIGTPGEEWTLRVEKAWDGVAEEDRAAVSVSLQIGGLALDAVELNAQNGWTASFEGLPNPDTLLGTDGGKLTMTVVENGDAYVADVSPSEIDEDTKTIYVTVTNSPKAEPATGELLVHKTVTGEGADPERRFDFTVTLANADGTPSELSGTYGDMAFEGGVATFSLADGESAWAKNLPAGLRWSVEEAPAEGYAASCDLASGEISEGTCAISRWTNTYEGQPPADDETPTDGDIPRTGDPTAPVASALACAAGTVVLAAAARGLARRS